MFSGFLARRVVGVLALAGVLAVGAAGCAGGRDDPPSTGGAPASTPAKAGPVAGGAASGTASGARTVSAAAFAEAIARPGTVVIDVRMPSEYAAGHLKGARNIDVQAADFGQKIAALDRSVTYAVYCRTGKRSANAVQTMSAAGFTSLVDLAGGITAWTAENREVVT